VGGVSPDQFVARYPYLWHMAEDGTWPSIQKHGLRSTSSLLDLYDVKDEQRRLIEACHRPVEVELRADGLPRTVIRDQAPMSDRQLLAVLDEGLTPSDWYRLLNERVFFWVSSNRLERLLGARLYRNRPHTVLKLDSRRILERYASSITLSPINSGATLFNPPRRGPNTFRRLETYPFWERVAMGADAVVELAVSGMVANIEECVVSVERRSVASQPVALWPLPRTSGDEDPEV
jgi:hypothetical protein